MASSDKSSHAPGPAELTPRQHEVLALVASGLSTLEIARRLEIAPGTVKTHLGTIYKLIGAKNRVQAARFYLDHLSGPAR